jgi:hypothetical protein
MVHDVVSAEHRGGYRVEVVFDDGRRGVVDFSSYAERGGAFARFRDTAFFRDFHINEELGVLAWGDSDPHGNGYVGVHDRTGKRTFPPK